MTYAIDDKFGQELAAGLRTEDEAFALAERLANERGDVVCVYGVGEDASELGATTVEPETTKIDNAIARSISHDEIVHLDLSDIGQDGVTELLGRSDDSVTSDGVTEYWGQDDEGATWRIHVAEHA